VTSPESADELLASIGWSIRILSEWTTTRSSRPARRSAFAWLVEPSVTRMTLSSFAFADAATTWRPSEDNPPTTPTRWVVGPPLEWIVGMTTAAATPTNMTMVPIRKMRPRTRSRISRPATKPTSPRAFSILCAQERDRRGARMAGMEGSAAVALRSGRRRRRTTEKAMRATSSAATKRVMSSFTGATPGTPRRAAGA
jgi:hypothetical protein